MQKTARVIPNQSLLDVVISEYGSLEAGMAVAAENGIAISHVPTPGDFLKMPALNAAKMDLRNADYFRSNNVTIGTLALPELSLTVLLKPVMSIEPSESGNPHGLGYYAFVFKNTDDFVHVYPLVSSFLSDNKLYYETEERYILGYAPENSVPTSVTSMPATTIPYRLPWTVGLGYMQVWSNMMAPVITPTFRDNLGNEAYYAPLTLIDNVDMGVVIARYVSDINIDVISSSPTSMILRLTRTHPPITLADYADHTMTWLGAAATGTEDPEDPGNPNKTILTLTTGIYTLGVKTAYFFPGGDPEFPPSAFTMVISIN